MTQELAMTPTTPRKTEREEAVLAAILKPNFRELKRKFKIE
jgi:hypothetical protein